MEIPGSILNTSSDTSDDSSVSEQDLGHIQHTCEFLSDLHIEVHHHYWYLIWTYMCTVEVSTT
jgi:hypothetical protein